MVVSVIGMLIRGCGVGVIVRVLAEDDAKDPSRHIDGVAILKPEFASMPYSPLRTVEAAIFMKRAARVLRPVGQCSAHRFRPRIDVLRHPPRHASDPDQASLVFRQGTTNLFDVVAGDDDMVVGEAGGVMVGHGVDGRDGDDGGRAAIPRALH